MSDSYTQDADHEKVWVISVTHILGISHMTSKDFSKRQSIAIRMKKNYSKLTENTIPPDRIATCILKSLACSKVKATHSRSLVEQTKLTSYVHSKKNKEHT